MSVYNLLKQLIILLKKYLVNYLMKKGSILLITFWIFAFLIIAWLLPLMAMQYAFLDSFLSFCVSFIK